MISPAKSRSIDATLRSARVAKAVERCLTGHGPVSGLEFDARVLVDANHGHRSIDEAPDHDLSGLLGAVVVPGGRLIVAPVDPSTQLLEDCLALIREGVIEPGVCGLVEDHHLRGS